MNKTMQAALVLAVMLAAAFSVTVVADNLDAAVIGDIEEPDLPADFAEGYAIDEETGSVVLADDVPCVAKIGERQFASLADAVAAAKKMTGNVTITILGKIDLTGSFTGNTLSYDLSDSGITSLTIQGSGESASFTSGIDGSGIDVDKVTNRPVCPALSFELLADVPLTVTGITFEDDLWLDNDNGPLTFTGCTFHGSISAYPQSDRVTFYDNDFYFDGTASKFYTNNAYPMWFKINGSDVGTTFNLVFTKNYVEGYRGVHVESRPGSTVNMTVTDNIFILSDTDYTNKTIALQLVNQMSGKVVFTGNTVDAYMAVCLFKDVNFTGTIEYAGNTLQNGCKAFGSSEWNSDNAGAADDFAASLLPARIGDVYYPSLAEALDAVQNGQTITLLDDVTETVTIDSGIDLTLDLNGHTLHYDGTIPYNEGGDETINIVNGTLTITDSSEWSVTADEEYNVTYNGKGSVTYNGSGRAIKVSGANAHLIVNGGYIHSDGGDGIYVTGNTTPDGAAWNCSVTMNGGYVHSTEYGIGVAGKGAILTMNGGYVEADNNAAIGGNGTSNGSSFRGGTVVTVTGGTVIGNITSSGYISCGIYHPQAGTLTISGGTIVSTNGVGVLMRGGQMVMTDGEIIAKGTGEGKVGDSNILNSGSGIYVDLESGYYDNANIDVTARGGSVESEGDPIVFLPSNAEKSDEYIQVTGGNYSDDVSEFVAEGYVFDADTGNIVLDTSTGAKVIAVIGDTQYPSLEAALDNVSSGDTIVLQNDTAESITISSDLSITLNLNGHTITNTKDQNTITVEGELTIIDDTGIGTIDNISNGKSAIYNNGIVTIKSGNITKSVNEAGNTYYVVFNHGTMSIEGGHIYSEGTAASSLIVNGYSQSATMTISGGHIEFWFNAVKNEEYGTLTVTGGTIDSNHQSIQNWNEATITGGTFNGEVATWHYNANNGSHTMTIEGGTFNDDVYTAKYVDDLETGDIGTITADPQITIKGGVFNGGLFTIKGDLTNSEILTPTEDKNYDWMDVSGGTFTRPVEDRFLAFGYALTGNNGMYGVGQGHKITFDVSIKGCEVKVTSSDGAIEYEPEADGSYLLADGSYRAIFTASGYGATSIDFEVDGSDSTIPVKMSAVYGITITATPSEAEITIDGKSVENGIEVQLTEGTHKVTVSLDGYVTETFEITVGENGQTAYTVALDPVDDGPDYPPIIPGGDDDDVVIPPIYVPSDTSSSDDDTVKIVACAAAAVVAAIMAAFLILGHRRD